MGDEGHVAAAIVRLGCAAVNGGGTGGGKTVPLTINVGTFIGDGERAVMELANMIMPVVRRAIN